MQFTFSWPHYNGLSATVDEIKGNFSFTIGHIKCTSAKSVQADNTTMPASVCLSHGKIQLWLATSVAFGSKCWDNGLKKKKKKKRRQIFLSDKIKIVNAVVNRENQAALWKQWDCQSRLRIQMWTTKQRYRQQPSVEKINPKHFRLREAMYPDIESALLMCARGLSSRYSSKWTIVEEVSETNSHCSRTWLCLFQQWVPGPFQGEACNDIHAGLQWMRQCKSGHHLRSLFIWKSKQPHSSQHVNKMPVD